MSNPLMKNILKNAQAFRKGAKKKNPMKGTNLPCGDYIAILRKVTLAEFTKGEEKTTGVRFDIVAVCDKDGSQEGILGEPCQITNRFAETEKQTFEQSVDRFFFNMQDAGLDTSALNTDKLDEELDDLNANTLPLWVNININAKDESSMKNVNLRGNPSPDVLSSFGFDPDSPALPDDTSSSPEDSEGVEEEAEEETVAEEEAVAGDEFDEMDRLALRKYIAGNKLDIKVFTNTSDDEIRNKIREAVTPVDEVAEEEEEQFEEEIEEEEPAPRKAPVKKAAVKKPARK